MKVRDILLTKGDQVFTVHPDQTVEDVVSSLMKHRIGSLLVVGRDGRMAGIITERDVLRECLGGAERLSGILVRDAMTRDLVVGMLDDSLDETMAAMTRHRVRHLPIVAGDQVVGVVSIGDVVRASLDEASYENGVLKDYIGGGASLKVVV